MIIEREGWFQRGGRSALSLKMGGLVAAIKTLGGVKGLWMSSGVFVELEHRGAF